MGINNDVSHICIAYGFIRHRIGDNHHWLCSGVIPIKHGTNLTTAPTANCRKMLPSYLGECSILVNAADIRQRGLFCATKDTKCSKALNGIMLCNYQIRRSTKTSKLRVTGLCAENAPVTGEFPAHKASNAESVSIWWCHHLLLDTTTPRATFCNVR